MISSAREMYLSSLDTASELAARRLAETSGIPDNDPLWMLLYELHRSARQMAADANAAVSNDTFAARLSIAISSTIAKDERIAAALTTSIRKVQEGALGAVRSLEVALRESARRRASAPFASVAFAFALAVTVSFGAIWSIYQAAVSYGRESGYRVGFNSGILYERSHR